MQKIAICICAIGKLGATSRLSIGRAEAGAHRRGGLRSRVCEFILHFRYALGRCTVVFIASCVMARIDMLALISILVLVLPSGSAQSLPHYDVVRAKSPIVIDGKLDDAAWQDALPVGEFHFNWWKAGERELTVARMLWDDSNLYVGYFCHDKHISASVTQRHGPVSHDDCVEIFLSPNPQKPKNYYTFEINAIGTMLNRCRTDWWSGPPTWDPEGVVYRTSLHGLPRKEASPQDDHWTVELAIPFRNFVRDAAHTPPQSGDEWRLNLMRTGGVTNAQDSTWSPIPAGIHSFHTPEAFGTVRFVNGPAVAQVRNPRGRRGRPASTNPLGRGSEVIEAGRQLYNSSCTVCHGLEGTVGDRGPALAATRRYLRTSDDDLFNAIKNGIPGTLMPAAGMPDNDIWRVVAYIRSLRATASDEFVTGNVKNGEQVFRAKSDCIKCHMIDGRGGLLGPDLSNIGAERSLRDLRLALTSARPSIPRGFQPLGLTTKSGEKIDGVIKNEDNFSLQVMDRNYRVHLLNRADVEQLEYGKKSLMPSDYGNRLSTEDLQDLLAFLSRRVRQ